MEDDHDENLPLVERFSPPSKNDETTINIEDAGSNGNEGAKTSNNQAGKKTQLSPKPRTTTAPIKTEMHQAAEVGDAKKLLKLVKENPLSLGLQSESGQTPLHLAAKGKHFECCEILLEKSSKEVNIKDNNGYTPLLLSIQSGATSTRITKLLLSKPAKVFTKNKFNQTALHIAAEKGNLNTVKLLLENTCNKEEINVKDREQQSPLHLAAKKGHTPVCIVLINAGADKELKDSKEYTALHWAAKQAHSNCIEELLKRKCDVNCTDKNDDTPLHLFCSSGKNRPHFGDTSDKTNEKMSSNKKDKSHCAEILLSKGADPNAKNKHGKTPFHVAQLAPYEVKTTFKDHSVALTITDNEGKTVLHLAASRRHDSKHVQFILSMEEMRELDKVDFINTQDKNGITALHMAVKAGVLESCKLLIRNGADATITCNSGNTALHLAAGNGLEDITSYLLAIAVETNARNFQSLTPLHMAAKNGHRECCKILLKQQADFKAVDTKGNTALHYAAEEGHSSCYQILKGKWPASVREFNNYHKSPIHIAIEKKSLECCQTLVTAETNLWMYKTDGVSSPMKLAYDCGLFDIFEYLLKKCIEPSKTQGMMDLDFYKLMEDSILKSNREVIQAIIDSSYCEISLGLDSSSRKNKTLQSKNENLKNLIWKFPELAKKVFDKALPQDVKAHREMKEESEKSQKGNDQCKPNEDDTKENAGNTDAKKRDSDKKTSERNNNLGKKDENNVYKLFYINHIFSTNQIKSQNYIFSSNIQKEHLDLLKHKLVTCWTEYKWQKYVRFRYFLSVLTSLTLAALLTAYSTMARSWANLNEAYTLNKTIVCSPKPLLTPDVIEYLRSESYTAIYIKYAIACILGIWTVHHIHKLIKLRMIYFRMSKNIGFSLCGLCSLLFLPDFSACSRFVYVKEDWQWSPGSLAVSVSWIMVLIALNNAFRQSPLTDPLLSALKAVIAVVTPIILGVFILKGIVPKGSTVLHESLDTMFVLLTSVQSLNLVFVATLYAILCTTIIKMLRGGQENDRNALIKTNLILESDLLYPCFRTRLCVETLSADEAEKFLRSNSLTRMQQNLKRKIM